MKTIHKVASALSLCVALSCVGSVAHGNGPNRSLTMEDGNQINAPREVAVKGKTELKDGLITVRAPNGQIEATLDTNNYAVYNHDGSLFGYIDKSGNAIAADGSLLYDSDSSLAKAGDLFSSAALPTGQDELKAHVHIELLKSRLHFNRRETSWIDEHGHSAILLFCAAAAAATGNAWVGVACAAGSFGVKLLADKADDRGLCVALKSYRVAPQIIIPYIWDCVDGDG